MADDGRMAFARLFSQRRETLDMSVVDIAVQTGRPIEVVVGWDQGTVVPDIDDLTKVSEVLKLPQPLLEEALRRVTDHGGDSALDPQSPQESDNETDPQTAGEPAAASRGTLIPASLASATFTDRLSQIPQQMWRSVTSWPESLSRRRRMERVPTAYRSYLEYRDQLIAYRLRIVYTAAGVAVLAMILRWSLSGLGSAITDLWDALTGAL